MREKNSNWILVSVGLVLLLAGLASWWLRSGASVEMPAESVEVSSENLVQVSASMVEPEKRLETGADFSRSSTRVQSVSAQRSSRVEPTEATTVTTTPAALRVIIDRAWDLLPTKAAVQQQGSPDGFHSTPPAVFQATESLAEIEAAMKSDSANISVGLQFYEDCAKNGDLLSSIRGYCLKELSHWLERQGTTVEWNDYPENIARIAKQLR